MANDDRRRGGWRERGEREERAGRGPEWRGDDGFGGGWGNQIPRPHRLGARPYDGPGDDSGDESRYGAGGGWYGPDAAASDYRYGGPGLDAERQEPRFERADRGDRRYGASMLGRSAYDFSFQQRAERARQRHDPHYSDWRQRQMDEFDRDYDEYRREHQSRFDREFGEWRQRRGEQRAALGRVKEHMEVKGSDGGHVGIVDCTRGDRIVLTRSDPEAGGVHHTIPCAWIASVDDKIVLTIPAEEAQSRWQEENRSRALFEREHRGVPGPHVLNRSFAGTYPDEE
ncbi:MAG: DUF2171 domain-containing protein [Sphingomonadaceae bacterium]|nr:DUF2171 domain-containing protein [Sphingomonadaceae bacterium]